MSYVFYTPKYFKPEELVPRDWVDRWFYVLDPIMLRAIDLLREQFGSIIVNNYLWGGRLQFAGFRPPDCTVGNSHSQHRFGRAADLKFRKDVLLSDVINYCINGHLDSGIIENLGGHVPVQKLNLVGCLMVYDWGIHIDTRNTIYPYVR